MSAQTKEGISVLAEAIDQLLGGSQATKTFLIPHELYGLVSRLRNEGCLQSEETMEKGVLVEARPSSKLLFELSEFQEN